MNRIILIGNGFDLAHKMKTTFCNFLDDYWEELLNDIIAKKKEKRFENDDIIIPEIPPFIDGTKTYKQLKSELKNYQSKIEFKNLFLEIISERSSIENWVDIENEYYSLLKNCYKNSDKNYTVSQLNQDFDKIYQKD